jgi:hypothetical protein
MSATQQGTMRITVQGLAMTFRERLRARLDQAAKLRCAEHDQPIVEVTIYGRENGWFDARWTTCCESLEQQAVALVKDRC